MLASVVKLYPLTIHACTEQLRLLLSVLERVLTSKPLYKLLSIDDMKLLVTCLQVRHVSAVT